MTIKGGLRKPSFLHKRFAPKIPWEGMKWTRPVDFPMLKNLVPVPVGPPSDVQTSDVSIAVSSLDSIQAVSGLVRSKSLNIDNRPKINKPRTRSERLRIQQAKKMEFKKKMKSVK